jgi:intergrase/recombinase
LRESKKIMGETDVWRFFASKFGELTVSARHYMDLLKETDKVYSKYVTHIYTIIGDAIQA